MNFCPYPGLRAFNRDEIGIFFGREQQTDELLEKLQLSHFLAVIGPSGCGKSSLVRTGLLSGLGSGFMAGAGASWAVAGMKPGNHPFTRLAEALLNDPLFAGHYQRWMPANLGDDWTQQALPFLHASLKRGPLSLHELLTDMQLPQETSLLLLVDQFEEIFRYQQYAENDANAFISLLLKASQHQAIYVVITMRSDFLGNAAAFQGLPEAINEGLYLTPRMTRDQLADAISLPARAFGGSVEPALVTRLLNEAGGATDQLPLLQHLLMRLWDTDTDQHLTLKEYEAMGGLRQALNDHAEEAWKELMPKQQVLAEQMFRLLTERAREGQDIRRPVRLSDLAAITQASLEELEAIVEKFRQPGRNFLLPPANMPLSADSIIDITHESLIRQWSRLREWVTSEAENAELYRRLQDTAERYNQGKAALLASPDLEIALHWRERRSPTREWARRYGSGFDMVMRFLDASLGEKREQQRLVEEENRERIRLRYRRPLIGFALGLLCALLFAGVGWFAKFEADAGEKTAEQNARYQNYLSRAAVYGLNWDFKRAEDALRRAMESTESVSPALQFQGELLERYLHMQSEKPAVSYDAHGIALHDVVLSLDKRWLMAVGEKHRLMVYSLDSGNMPLYGDGTTVIASAAPLQQRMAAPRLSYEVTEPHTLSIQDIALHPDGQHFATGGDDGKIVLWNMPTSNLPPMPLREKTVPGRNNRVKALAFSADGYYLVSGGTDARVSMWQFTSSGDGLERIWQAAHDGQISEGGLGFTPDGQWVVSASHDGSVRFWDKLTGKPVGQVLQHGDKVLGMAFSPDGNRLATASGTQITLWDWRKGKRLHSFPSGHGNMIFSLSWVRDNQDNLRLVSASMDHTLRLWDVENAVVLRVLQGHNAEVGVSGLAYDSARRVLYSPGKDGKILEWNMDIPDMRLLRLAVNPQRVSINAAGDVLAVGLADGTLNTYRFPSLEPLASTRTPEKTRILHLAFSPTEPLLAVVNTNLTPEGDWRSALSLWRMQPNGQLVRETTALGVLQDVAALRWATEGNYLLVAERGGRVGVLPTGPEGGAFNLYTLSDDIVSIDISADSKHLILAGHTTVEFHEIQDGMVPQQKPLSRFSNGQEMYAVRVSADNQWLATVGRNASVLLRKLDDDGLADASTPAHLLDGHTQTVVDAGFIQPGNMLMTGGTDATLRGWDLDSGEMLYALHLPSHNGYPTPFRQFDMRCTEQGCQYVVPLEQEKSVVVYNFMGAGRR